MLPDLYSISLLLEALIVGFAVLAGMMAAESGLAAWKEYEPDSDPAQLTPEINRGIAAGFETGTVMALIAFTIVLGTA